MSKKRYIRLKCDRANCNHSVDIEEGVPKLEHKAEWKEVIFGQNEARSDTAPSPKHNWILCPECFEELDELIKAFFTSKENLEWSYTVYDRRMEE